LTGWLKGKNLRTNEEGLFPAGEYVKFVTVSSVLRPRPVPKPRPSRSHPPAAAAPGYVAKLEINDSGYDGSPRGIIYF